MVPSSEFDKEYAVIADANFSVLLGGFGATDVPTVELQIAAAQKHGLAVIPSYCKGDCVNITTGGSDLWGFQVADEPRMSNFDELAPAVAAVKAQGKLAFVNLLPNYAGPSEFAAGTYGEYVSTFISKVKPNLVSVDHYPDFDPSPDHVRNNKTKQGYIDNLLVLRDLTLKAGWVRIFYIPPGGIYIVYIKRCQWKAPSLPAHVCACNGRRHPYLHMYVRAVCALGCSSVYLSAVYIYIRYVYTPLGILGRDLYMVHVDVRVHATTNVRPPFSF